MVAPIQPRLVEPVPQFMPATWLGGTRVAAGVA
jgi:hypothetical protein